MNDELFELASAYHDSEVSPEEADQVTSDDESMRVIEQLARLRSALSGTAAAGPLDETLKERQVQAALAVLANIATESENDSTVVSLAAARSQPPSRRTWLAPALSAAAVTLVAVAGLLVVIQLNETENSQSTAADATSENFDATEESDSAMADLDEADDHEANGAAASTAYEESRSSSETSGDESTVVADRNEKPMEEGGEPARSEPDQEADTETITVELDAIPTEQQQADFIRKNKFNIEIGVAVCAQAVNQLGALEPVGFLPVIVAGEPGEAFLFEAPANRVQLLRFFDSECNQIG